MQDVFNVLATDSELGRIRTHADAFDSAEMHSDTLGSAWTCSTRFGILGFFEFVE